MRILLLILACFYVSANTLAQERPSSQTDRPRGLSMPDRAPSIQPSTAGAPTTHSPRPAPHTIPSSAPNHKITPAPAQISPVVAPPASIPEVFPSQNPPAMPLSNEQPKSPPVVRKLHSPSVAPTTNRQAGRLLVMVKNKDSARAESLFSRLTLQVETRVRLEALESTLFRLMAEETHISRIRATLRNELPNATIDYNHYYTPAGSKPRVYHKELMKWPNASTCKAHAWNTVKLGVVDALPEIEHPSLKHQSIIIKSFVEGAPRQHAHATAILSLLVGSPDQATLTGLLPRAQVYHAAVLERQAVGALAGSSFRIAQAINWLAGQHVSLINLSFAAPQQNLILHQALQVARNKGISFFAAAGNAGPDARPFYPAAYPEVLAVSGVDIERQIYPRANQGAYIDFVAPGVDLWVARGTTGGGYVSGTSYAAPLAMAHAAMLLANHPSLSPDMLLRAMSQQVVDLGMSGKDPVYGYGLLQLDDTICSEML